MRDGDSRDGIILKPARGLRSVLIGLCIALTSFSIDLIWACSCSSPSPQEALLEASAIFRGRVVKIDRGNLGCAWAVVHGAVASVFGRDEGQYVEAACMIQVTLSVDEAWKLSPREVVTVYTGRGGGDCGFPFEVGQEYVVFTHYRAMCLDDCFETDICTATTRVSDAAEILAMLGPSAADTP